MNEPLKQINWKKDDGLEFLLKDGKLEWKMEEVRLNDINLDESKKRQSRLDRVIDPERVLSIAVSMEQGVPIPAPCITSVKGFGKIILAGLHRVSGAKVYVADRDNSYTIKCYNVIPGKADTKYIHDMLPALTNAIEGVGLTLEQRRYRAAEMVETHGYPVDEVAAKYGLKPDTLSKYLSSLKLSERLIGLGVNVTKTLLKTSCLEALKAIDYNDNLLRAAAQIMATNDLSGDEVRTLVRNVKAARTEPAGLVAIGEASRVHSGKKTPDKAWSRSPRRSSFLQSLTKLINHVKSFPTYDSLQVTVPDDLEFCRRQVGELVELLEGLDGPQRKSKSA